MLLAVSHRPSLRRVDLTAVAPLPARHAARRSLRQMELSGSDVNAVGKILQKTKPSSGTASFNSAGKTCIPHAWRCNCPRHAGEDHLLGLHGFSVGEDCYNRLVIGAGDNATLLGQIIGEHNYARAGVQNHRHCDLSIERHIDDQRLAGAPDRNIASVVSQPDALLFSTSRARRTFSKMSSALAVHSNDWGLSLCSAM